jgi:hypothetical protein
MQPGEVQRWRLIDAGVEDTVIFKIIAIVRPMLQLASAVPVTTRDPAHSAHLAGLRSACGSCHRRRRV